jgi:hypothetical protein
MISKWTLLLLSLLLFSGCAPWISIDKIEPGMAKAEVLQQMGKPSSASGNGADEYLWYVPTNRFWERYYVHLVDGKVRAYGPLGTQEEKTQ